MGWRSIEALEADTDHDGLVHEVVRDADRWAARLWRDADGKWTVRNATPTSSVTTYQGRDQRAALEAYFAILGRMKLADLQDAGEYADDQVHPVVGAWHDAAMD